MDALILAGGKSSRMGGKHKGSLLIGEESFTQHLLNEFQAHADQVFVSYGEIVRQKLPGCQIVQDEYKDCGPMGGLHAGLKSCRSDTLMTAACDMPLLKWELYEYLLTQLADHDAVIPMAEGRCQPLAAIYRKTALPVLERCLRNGDFRMMKALEKINVCYADASKFAFMLKNINTEEEYRSFLQE